MEETRTQVQTKTSSQCFALKNIWRYFQTERFDVNLFSPFRDTAHTCARTPVVGGGDSYLHEGDVEHLAQNVLGGFRDRDALPARTLLVIVQRVWKDNQFISQSERTNDPQKKVFAQG